MNRLRLMTWNIHGALGRNPRFDLARVVEFVQKLAPDIVALLEVDSRRARAGYAYGDQTQLRLYAVLTGGDQSL